MTNPNSKPDPLARSLADIIEHRQALDLPIPGEPEPMVSTSIRLPLDLLDWARTEAARQGLPSWSALVSRRVSNAYGVPKYCRVRRAR